MEKYVAYLSLSGVFKRFSSTVAVKDVSLEIAEGEFVSLVGASGCGKTTLLRIIAGFTRPDAGTLTLAGKRMEMLPPNRRGVGFVFQSYALFPTQTVAENIGFSLAIRKRPKAEIRARVAELCSLTQLLGLEGRYPHELSGGQQQRVALARALAPNPSILLLDEPLSALDAKIRAHLRAEIRAVVDRLKITTVYVTHDQEEALSISDRVAVMHGGRILQVGPPIDVYLHPSTRYVAEFIGTSNRLEGRLAAGGRVSLGGQIVEATAPGGLGDGTVCVVCVRPEHIDVARANAGEDGSKLASLSFLGQTVRARLVAPAGFELIVDVPTADWLAKGLSTGDPVRWSIRPGSAMVFPGDEETDA
ncbi:MAG: ABC transporter ATP-binding protein [Rhodospirillales bacterium]|nr:ABC transporter ATP-binding protein [Rhodospirillales bacterium]